MCRELEIMGYISIVGHGVVSNVTTEERNFSQKQKRRRKYCKVEGTT